MTISASDWIAAAALLFGIVNFVIAKRTASQNRKRRMEDELAELLDDSFDLLYGQEGYSNTKNKTKFLEAEKKVTRALRINPKDPRAIEYQGHLFELNGDIPRARRNYERSIALDPKRARPYNWIGMLGEDDAEEKFGRAISLDPDGASVYHYQWAIFLDKHGKLDDAEVHLRLAIKQTPQLAYPHVKLGNMLSAQGKRDGNLGDFSSAQGKRDEARGHYEQAIKADPNDIDARVQLGRLLCEIPEEEDKDGTFWKDGMFWLESACKVNPRDSYPLRMIAALYADRKQPKEAIQYAEKVISIDVLEKLNGTTTRDILEAMQSLLKVQSAAAESGPADPIPGTETGKAK